MGFRVLGSRGSDRGRPGEPTALTLKRNEPRDSVSEVEATSNELMKMPCVRFGFRAVCGFVHAVFSTLGLQSWWANRETQPYHTVPLQTQVSCTRPHTLP